MPPLAREAVRFALRPRTWIALTACLFSTAMVVTATTPVADPDVFWVAAAGREMRQIGTVPTENVFSFVEAAHPWLMHEWLLGVPYAAGLGHFGAPFLVLTAIALLCLTLGLVAGGTLGRASEPTIGLLAAFVAILFFGSRFLTARPTGVALVFPLAQVLVAFLPRFRAREVGLALLIELVWANTHGSFPLGVVLLTVAAIAEREDRGLRFMTAAAAALVTLVNPYGIRLHVFVWSYLRGDQGIYREIHRHIYEFRNLFGAWGKTAGPVDLTGWILVASVACLALRERRHRIRAAFCLVLLVAALFQVRHLELAGLLSCVLLVPFADEKMASSMFARGQDATPHSCRAWILAPAYAIGIALFAVELGTRSQLDWIDGGAAFTEGLSAVPDGARLYVPFDRAGLAIWYGFPRNVRIYFDPRNDCYSAQTFRDFMALGEPSTPPAETLRLLDASGTDAVLVPEGHPLAGRLSPAPGWAATGPPLAYRAFARTRTAVR